MKKLILICFCLFGGWQAMAQDNTTADLHSLSLDFGSLRNRYLYPITNFRYISPELEALPIRFSARLRSYGTLYIFSKSAYDFTPAAEYVFGKKSNYLRFSAGLGMDVRLRLVKDVRSDATSSAEPLVILSAQWEKNQWKVALPLWTRFYSNGLSWFLQPEISRRLGNRWAVFFRAETGLLLASAPSSHEWRKDFFIGASFFLP